MKNTVGFIAFVLAVILFLFFLSTAKKTPALPDDALHRNMTANAACAACHAPGMRAPLKSSHPPKEDCLQCHKAKKAG